MKKISSKKDGPEKGDMLPEYDFSGGVRGKHYKARGIPGEFRQGIPQNSGEFRDKFRAQIPEIPGKFREIPGTQYIIIDNCLFME